MARMNRGANVALTREIPGLTRLVVGVAWDAGSERVLADNLVLALLLCGPEQPVLSGEHVCFFNQLTSPEDVGLRARRPPWRRPGAGEVDLQRVPAEVSRLVAVLYVNEGTPQRRTLGQLRSGVVAGARRPPTTASWCARRTSPRCCRPRPRSCSARSTGTGVTGISRWWRGLRHRHRGQSRPTTLPL